MITTGSRIFRLKPAKSSMAVSHLKFTTETRLEEKYYPPPPYDALYTPGSFHLSLLQPSRKNIPDPTNVAPNIASSDREIHPATTENFVLSKAARFLPGIYPVDTTATDEHDHSQDGLLQSLSHYCCIPAPTISSGA